MDPSPHLWFCAFTTATLWPELIVSLGPRPNLSLCARKTAWLAPELLVSMGPRPHLSFCASKTAWLALSLWVPALICGFCVQNSEFWIRTTSLYGSQTSPVDLVMQKGVLRSRMTRVHWSQPSSVVLWIQNSDFSITNTSLYGSQPSFLAFVSKTATLGPELQVSMDPRLHLWFLHSKQRL